MAHTQHDPFDLPTTWLELNFVASDLLIAVMVILGSVSLFAMASGEPETMALVAAVGIAVCLLGLSLLRMSEQLRTEGVPIA